MSEAALVDAMAEPTEGAVRIPSGVECIAIVARRQGLHIAAEQVTLDNHLSGVELSAEEIARCAAHAGMKAKRVLTRLTLAWSRDSGQKIYVQDRMRDVGRDLWAWIAEGAHVYVCGDAKRMAKDVEMALIEIVASFGLRSTNEAIAFVADLKKNGRYQQDVY